MRQIEDTDYFVGLWGDIYSIKRGSPKKIKLQNVASGYKAFSLCHEGCKKSQLVHRQVAKAYVKGYEEGLEVNHIDGNKNNNYYTNLEWVTHDDNMKHWKNHLLKRED